MKSADLHLHTEASDGKNTTVKDRLNQANNHDLKAIAITDHDTINDDLDQRNYCIDEVEVITGAEIKCEVEDTSIEILGYFIDPEDKNLLNLFDRLERFRTERMKEMISNVNDELDCEITLSEVRSQAKGPLGRPHLAQEMSKRGLVETPSEAFRQYIGDNEPCYVETQKVPANEVIQTLHENGAVTSLAHPGRDLTQENAESILEKLKSEGLDAVEVPYTYNHKRQEGYEVNFGTMEAFKLAKVFNLAITGGSDCHGSETDKFNIGKVQLDYSHVEELKNRAEKYRDS